MLPLGSPDVNLRPITDTRYNSAKSHYFPAEENHYIITCNLSGGQQPQRLPVYICADPHGIISGIRKKLVHYNLTSKYCPPWEYCLQNQALGVWGK